MLGLGVPCAGKNRNKVPKVQNEILGAESRSGGGGVLYDSNRRCVSDIFHYFSKNVYSIFCKKIILKFLC